MKYPFDDDDMTYSKITHRYTLTPESVFNRLGINLQMTLNTFGDANPSIVAKRMLERVSSHFYSTIYSYNPSAKAFIEKLLAKYMPCRTVVLECLLNETEYALQNGEFWNLGGINATKGQAMDLSTLRDARMLSPDTINRLSERLPNGVCLIYQGYYNLPPNMRYREDY